MKLIVIVSVCSLWFYAVQGIRVKSPIDGRYANVSSFSVNKENYIIGGELAPDGFAPYQVSIQTCIGSHFCSGVIINERWILTAGHCVIGWNVEKFLISSASNDNWWPRAYYYPDRVVMHCNYDNPLYHNDIALIHIDSVIEWDELTQPIEIATELPPAGSRVSISGWGKTDLNGDISRYKYKVETDYVAYKDCKSRYNGDNGVDIGHLCSLGQNAGTCHGDSGAPVVSDGKLIGISNWGTPCAKGYPDVHASVPFYYEWIQRTMQGCAYSWAS